VAGRQGVLLAVCSTWHERPQGLLGCHGLQLSWQLLGDDKEGYPRSPAESEMILACFLLSSFCPPPQALREKDGRLVQLEKKLAEERQASSEAQENLRIRYAITRKNEQIDPCCGQIQIQCAGLDAASGWIQTLYPCRVALHAVSSLSNGGALWCRLEEGERQSEDLQRQVKALESEVASLNSKTKTLAHGKQQNSLPSTFWYICVKAYLSQHCASACFLQAVHIILCTSGTTGDA